MKNSKVKYTADFRIKALNLAERVGMQQAARQLNIHLNTILIWKNKLNENGVQALANISRSQQKHPGRKLTDADRQAIIDLKESNPSLTYKQIKDVLNLNCAISIISRLLNSNGVQFLEERQKLFLTYKVTRNISKNIYTYILSTPSGIFMAEHDEMDIDFVMDCCNYWLEQLYSYDAIQPGFDIDASSLYLILKEKKRETLSAKLNNKFQTKIITTKQSHNIIEEFILDPRLSLTAGQFYYNFTQYRKFLPIPALSSTNLTFGENRDNLCLTAATELRDLGDQLFLEEYYGLALIVFELVVRCCEFIEKYPAEIYRQSMKKKAKIISYNKSFVQAEIIYKQLIAEVPDDKIAGWCWIELAEIYSYLDQNDLLNDSISNAEKVFNNLCCYNKNDQQALYINSKFAVLKNDDDKILSSIDKLLNLPDQSEFYRYKCYALYEKGCLFYNRHDFKKALILFDQLLNKHEWAPSNLIKAKIYFNIAQLEYTNQDKSECEKSLNLAIAKAEQVGYQLLLARCRQVEGIILERKLEYKRAISSYLHCLELFKNFNYGKDICRTCYQLSQVYQALNQPALQLRWAKEILKYSLPQSIDSFTVYAYDMICVYYYDQQNYKQLRRHATLLTHFASLVNYPFFKISAKVYIAISGVKLNRKKAGETVALAQSLLEPYLYGSESSIYQNLQSLLVNVL